MYALIDNNKIVKVFSNPQSFEHKGIKYSSQIFALWSNEEKQDIGIYEIEFNHQNKKDEAYFINTNEQFKFENGKAISYFGNAIPKSLEDVNEVDVDNQPILRDGVQLVTKGLKSQKIQMIKSQTSGLLQSSDWYVVRKSETGKAIPENISTFRTAVRTKSNEMEAMIIACNSVDELKSLFEYSGEPSTRPIGEFPKLKEI